MQLLMKSGRFRARAGRTPRSPRVAALLGIGTMLPLLTLSSAAAQPTLPKDGDNRVIQTWAKKGLTRNPVAICIDPQGNVYVAESDRAGNAVQDTRNLKHLHAVEDDLKLKSVEDRRAQIRGWIQSNAFAKDYFTKTEDRVRVLSDTDADGVADAVKVFAGGFNEELDGIGSGLMWYEGSVYYTCIPNLWILKDTSSPPDLQADERKSISYGYGVRWCFYGHDLHGLTMGPDGRVYFSMGDRGFNVTTAEGKHLVGVDRGGVFRCWPDGSGLELYYQGLRNPQDLAFNDLGDLFTGDNNCDSGDRARVVAIYEGGDSGWRQDVQSLDSRGPWNREAIWKTLKDVSGPARPAWTLPPIEYKGDGPSGIEFYPGVGESHAYDGCFFMVDFYGSGAKVHSFRCVPDGAGFKLADAAEYYKGSTITDIKWGYDSRLYMSDWGGGWNPNDNGNIVTLTNKTVHDDPAEAAAIKEIKQLFEAGFEKRPDAELLSFLGHRDQRVRIAAQFELARRGTPSAPGLTELALGKDVPMVTRSHAIWAIGQIARKDPAVASKLVPLLNDPLVEARVQGLRTLGDPAPRCVAGRRGCVRGAPEGPLGARAARRGDGAGEGRRPLQRGPAPGPAGGERQQGPRGPPRRGLRALHGRQGRRDRAPRGRDERRGTTGRRAGAPADGERAAGRRRRRGGVPDRRRRLGGDRGGTGHL